MGIQPWLANFPTGFQHGILRVEMEKNGVVQSNEINGWLNEIRYIYVYVMILLYIYIVIIQ